MNKIIVSLKAPILVVRNKDTKVLNILSKMAVAVEPVSAVRVAAAIVYRGDTISFGVNSRRSHPFQARFARNDQQIFMHAENAAIHRAMRHLSNKELAKSTLYVSRVKHRQNDQSGNMIHAAACPCSGCMLAIEQYGIKNIIHTNEVHGYTTLRLN
jgi:tRNA(Arg) A34 adenosine deaminase TadA